MRLRHVFLLLLFLLMAYIGLRPFLFPLPDQITPNAPLLPFDEQAITSLMLESIGRQQALVLTREQQRWISSDGVNSAVLPDSTVQDLLQKLLSLRSIRVASVSQQIATVTSGFHIELFNDREKFVVFDLLPGKDTSYLSFATSPLYYATSGLQLDPARYEPQRYFSRQLLNLPSDVPDTFYYQRPGATYTFVRKADAWRINQTFRADTNQIKLWYDAIRQLKGAQRAERFDPLAVPEQSNRSLRMPRRGQADVELRCYYDSLRTPPFIIGSDQFTDRFFVSDSSDLFRRLFQPLDTLLPQVD